MKSAQLTYVLFLASAVLAGCAVIPTSRTYYEPNQSDGTPYFEKACGGYLLSNYSVLSRKVSSTTMFVQPIFAEGRPLQLRVMFYFRDPAEEILLDSNKLQLITSGRSFPPANPIVRDASPSYHTLIEYTFPQVAAAEEVSIVPLPGFMTVGGKFVDIKPFRFTRVTKLDVYSVSINC